MFRSPPFASYWHTAALQAFDARWPGARRRLGPIALTVLFEIVLLLVLLTLGTGGGKHRPSGEVVTTFDAKPVEEVKPEQAASKPPAAAAARHARTDHVPPPSALPMPPPIVLPRPPVAPPLPPAAPPAETPPAPATSKIRAVIRSDMAAAPGVADTGGRGGDSKRIAGSGPHGEALYAAQWYPHEPYPDELRGYLSLVDAPAWALINCKTEPEFRVDQCVLVDQWPDGSNIGRAVLAAAWEFKVRAPRVGGRTMVGEWVRIRIDYTRDPQ